MIINGDWSRVLACLGLLACVLGMGRAGRAEEARPNVLIVLIDDMGYGDLGCHGSPHVPTPNLDALHAGSVRLVDFHVAPMCSPTRGQLLTGGVHYLTVRRLD